MFGATAAAALYRREMIDDISIDGEFFDPDFFVYREDADVAWRAQLLGWRCMYTPQRSWLSCAECAARQSARAAVRHQHAFGEEPLPDADEEHDAGSVSAELGFHHRARSRGGRLLPAREFIIAQGFWYVARNWRRVLEKRAEIMKRRRVTDEYLASWFSYEPVAKPAPKSPSRRPPCEAPRPESCSAVVPDDQAAEDCPAGHARHSCELWRFRDFRGGAVPPARGSVVITSPSIAGTVTANATYLGVDLQYLPTIRHKYFDTIAHTFLSTLHLLVHRHDVALYCNAANAIFTWMPRIAGIPVALNVDGLERKRKKWNCACSRVGITHRSGSRPGCRHVIVSDAEKIRFYYRQNYGAESTFIPYGAEIGKVNSTGALQRVGLGAGRILPLRQPDGAGEQRAARPEAFEQPATTKKLALIGDAPYADAYIARVRDTKDPRVVIPGAIYGDGYKELQSHCFAYIHATEVGGTHPALIEAMGRGALTLYLDTPENREVAGEVAIPFHHDESDAETRACADLQ